MSTQDTEKYLLESIRLAMGNVKGRERATWPFGAVLVRDGQVLARAVNQVDELCDPSAHAEMQALRIAAKAQGSTDLSGSVMYASGYPCTMCHTAIARAKVQLGQAMRYVGQQSVQLHGGIGVTDEYLGSHYFKRLTQMEMTGGDTLYHLDIVSANMQDSAGVFA